MASMNLAQGAALDALGELLNKLNEADGMWAQAHTDSVWSHSERAFRQALVLAVGPTAAQTVWEMWLDNNAEPVTSLVAEFERSLREDVR